jgi:hypothetical protein
MADKQIIRYIRNGLSQGYSIDSLRKALLQKGWPAQDVNAAINELQGAPQQAQRAQPGYPPQRPTGVLIISILGILVSVFSILGALLIIGLGSFMAGGGFGDIGNFTMEGIEFIIPIEDVGTMFMILGIIPLILGILGLVAYILLLKMKKVGWYLVTVIGIISVIMAVLTFSITSIVTIVIWIIILAYLVTKRQLFV